MKRLLLILILVSLIMVMTSCGEDATEENGIDDQNGINEEGGQEAPDNGSAEEPEELEGMEYVIDYMEQEFPINEREPVPYDSLGATDGIAVRIGRELIEFYDFSEVGDEELAREAIDEASNNGTVNIDGAVFPAVYNEEYQVMLVDYEDHPQGVEIKARFDDI
jgi:hypothetical protein